MKAIRAVVALLAAALLLSACGSGGTAGGGEVGPVAAPNDPVQLSSSEASTSFELQNTSERALDWQIEASHSATNPQPGDWFTVTPGEGRLGPGERQVITLTRKPGLQPGRYTSVLTVSYQGGRTQLEVIGEAAPGSSFETGDGSISGTLHSDNALIPLAPPTRFAAMSPSLERRDGGPRAASAATAGGEFVPGQLVVGLEKGARMASADGETPAKALVERHGLLLLEESAEDGWALVAIPEDADAQEAAARLEGEPGVLYAEPNHLFYPHALPNDPYLTDSWHLAGIGAPVAWHSLPTLGQQPVVAVIESGIDLDHEDLRGIFVSTGYDFCAAEGCQRKDGDPRPAGYWDTHGTHVSGLLAAQLGNGRGSAGAAGSGARLLPIKVFHEGRTTATALANAITWASGGSVEGVPNNPHPARIITLSLGGREADSTLQRSIENARGRGALIIASSGNSGEREVDYPARYPGVLGVGSVNTAFRRSCFSDYGTGLDIVAPGGDGYLCSAPRNEGLLSTLPGNDYGIDAGTSMAAPLVAAAAALVWANEASPGASLVRKRLLESAMFDSGYMTTDEYGAGVLRLDQALGFPGPGDPATVQASGPSTAVDTVTLLRDGSSTRFDLENLAGGSYSLAADASGRTRSLAGSDSLRLGEGETLEEFVIRLGQ